MSKIELSPMVIEFGDYLETQIYENNPRAMHFDRTWYQERFNGLLIDNQGDLEIQVDCDSDPDYFGDLVSLAINFCKINNIEWNMVIVNPC